MELMLIILGVAVVFLMLDRRPGRGGGAGPDSGWPAGDPVRRFHAARVRQVIDGDSVIVIVDGKAVQLRLNSIDAPEHDQAWGDIAKYGLIKLIGGRWIRFEDHGVDDYGRTLATVFVKGRDGTQWIDVNRKMVVLGHAWVQRIDSGDRSGEQRNEFARLERWARRKKVGLWRSADPLPPWKWRHRGR